MHLIFAWVDGTRIERFFVSFLVYFAGGGGGDDGDGGGDDGGSRGGELR